MGSSGESAYKPWLCCPPKGRGCLLSPGWASVSRWLFQWEEPQGGRPRAKRVVRGERSRAVRTGAIATNSLCCPPPRPSPWFLRTPRARSPCSPPPPPNTHVYAIVFQFFAPLPSGARTCPVHIGIAGHSAYRRKGSPQSREGPAAPWGSLQNAQLGAVVPSPAPLLT